MDMSVNQVRSIFFEVYKLLLIEIVKFEKSSEKKLTDLLVVKFSRTTKFSFPKWIILKSPQITQKCFETVKKVEKS
jgi:hypothetical protein